LLTKASFDPSGDHLRLLLVPQALISLTYPARLTARRT
jgi:hypothetical protein